MSSSLSKPTIVIVPGILHTSAHFDRLRAALEPQGYPIHAINLPSIGAKAATAPPQADGAAVRAAVTQLVEAGRLVVILAHSYGGVPASEAVRGLTIEERKAEGKAGGVVEVVFLTAVVVRKGESMTDCLERFEGGRENRALMQDPSRPGVLLVKPGVSPALYHDLSNQDADHYTALLQPIAANHADQIASDPPWNMPVRKTYVFCSKDRAILPYVQQGMFDDVKDESWTAESIDCGHSPFLSHVGELVAVIERVVARAAGAGNRDQ